VYDLACICCTFAKPVITDKAEQLYNGCFSTTD